MSQHLSDDRATPTHSFPTFVHVGRGALKLADFAKRQWVWGLRLLLLLVVAYSGLSLYASLLLNRELSAIRSLGEPLTRAELKPRLVPIAENAGFVYNKAAQAVVMKGMDDYVLSRAFTTDKSKREAGIRILRANRKAVAFIRRATAMPQCQFSVNWTLTPDRVTYTHFKQQRLLSRLLSAQAHFEAQNGDADAALRDVRSLYVMADHLSGETTDIGFYIGVAMNSLANETLADVLGQVNVPADEGKAFLKSLPHTDWSRAMRLALLGERTFTIWACEHSMFSSQAFIFPIHSNEDVSPFIAIPFDFLWRPFLKLDEVHALRYWKKFIPAVTSIPIPKLFPASLDLNAELRDLPRYAFMSRTLLVSTTQNGYVRAHAEVSLRQREVVLAIAAFHAAQGRYPGTLAQAQKYWGTKLPADPYAGNGNNLDFRYRKNGQGYLLYSVGVNGLDNQGLKPLTTNTLPNLDDDIWSGADRLSSAKIY